MADPSAIKHVPCYIYTIASKYFYSIWGHNVRIKPI